MGRLALLLAATAVALLAAEGVLRLLPATTLGFDYERERFGKPPEFTPDPTRNALGFHDVDHGPRREGVRRLLLLGDSYVEGRSVALEQTLGRRLEHHLNAASGERWEVVALGRAGWSQRHQLPALERYGPGLRPDVVLGLFLTLNDVRENSDALDAAVRAQLDLAELRPGFARLPAEAAPLFLVRGSRLNQWISFRLALLRKSDDPASIPVDYLVYATPAPEPWPAAWRTTEGLLERTRETARGLGARYQLASASTPQGVLGPEAGLARLRGSYPAMAALDWDLDQPDRRLAAFAREHGIPFLALEPVFREATARGERLHWRYDGHWNAAGNDLAARELAAFVLGTRGG